MRDLVIMPAMAQRRESLNMGEFAEEAIIVEEVTAPKRVNHFIEANTQPPKQPTPTTSMKNGTYSPPSLQSPDYYLKKYRLV